MRAPIVLWAVPRSVSTAFERMMRARGDLVVFSEPFSAPYYFSDHRVSDRFGEENVPGADWATVVGDVTAAAQDATVFVKDMAYHVSPCLGPDLVARFRNTFIVRHPGHTLASLGRLLPDFTWEEAGFEQQHRLMTFAAESAREELVVIDGEELRRAPETVIEDYCRRVGLPFVPASLRWREGLVPDWGRWEEWHGDVAASTRIRRPLDGREPGPPEGVDPEVYAGCLDLYEQMLELGGLGRAA